MPYILLDMACECVYVPCGFVVVQKNLEVGEILSVDICSIIALSTTVDVQIKYNGPMRRVVFGVIYIFL